MKIRLGFVTNSSSSSFVMLKYRSDKLSEIVSIFQLADNFRDCLNYGFKVEDGELTYIGDDYFPDWEVPSSKVGAINCLLNELTQGIDYFEELEIYSKEAENKK